MTIIKIYCLGTILNLPVTFSPWSTFENNPSGFQRASVSPTPFPKGTGEGSAQKAQLHPPLSPQPEQLQA